jgi:hypothetical protein
MQQTNGKDHGASLSAQAPHVAQTDVSQRETHEPMKKRRIGILETMYRESILREIDNRGRERVLSDLTAIRKDGTEAANACILRCLLRDAQYSYSSTNYNLLKRLALSYRGDQQRLPLAPPPQRQVAAAPTPSPVPLAVAPQQPAGPLAADVAFITQVVATVMAAMGHGRPAAAAPPMLPPAAVASEDDGDHEPGIKRFEQMQPAQQRRILNSMHVRYAEHLKAKCGITTGEQGSAWNISYDAYDQETGANSQKRASAESDSTGVRVRPLDIIERDGELVSFWRVVRRVWER